MKKTLQYVIRQLHKRILFWDLPARVGVYLHSVEKDQMGEFEDCLRFWVDKDYVFVSAQGLCSSKGPDKRVFLSFDDNYRRWLFLLEPLARFNASVTFFLNTLPFRHAVQRQVIEDYFNRLYHKGERETLTRKELKELSDAGHFIGCHSHSHFMLRTLSGDQLSVEIRDSKAILEDILDDPVTDFALKGFPRASVQVYLEESAAAYS